MCCSLFFDRLYETENTDKTFTVAQNISNITIWCGSQLNGRLRVVKFKIVHAERYLDEVRVLQRTIIQFHRWSRANMLFLVLRSFLRDWEHKWNFYLCIKYKQHSLVRTAAQRQAKSCQIQRYLGLRDMSSFVMIVKRTSYESYLPMTSSTMATDANITRSVGVGVRSGPRQRRVYTMIVDLLRALTRVHREDFLRRLTHVLERFRTCEYTIEHTQTLKWNVNVIVCSLRLVLI